MLIDLFVYGWMVGWYHAVSLPLFVWMVGVWVSLCLQLLPSCLPPQMLITSLSSTYFLLWPFLLYQLTKEFCERISYQTSQIIPNLTKHLPRDDHCLKLNPRMIWAFFTPIQNILSQNISQSDSKDSHCRGRTWISIQSASAVLWKLQNIKLTLIHVHTEES